MTGGPLAGPSPESFPLRFPSRSLLWLLALLALGSAHLLAHPTSWDDAFISFRMAEHWSATGELAYNPGQVQPVATNFLWVTLLAAGHKLTGLSALVLARGLGGLAGLGVLALLFSGLHFFYNLRGAVLGTLLCAAAPLWAAWPLSGLETSLFTLLSLAGVWGVLGFWRTARRDWLWGAGGALGLATLARPEGLLWFGVAWLTVVLGNWRDRKSWTFLLLAYALVVVPAAGFQVVVFHTLVPNAFFAKVHGLSNWHAGWAYVADALKTYRLVYALPFMLPGLAGKVPRREIIYTGALLAVWCAWVVAVGGDFLPYHRFLSPAWPLACMLLGLGLDRLEATLEQAPRLSRWLPRGVTVAVAAFLSLAFLLPTYTGAHYQQAHAWGAEERDRKQVGLWLGAHYAPADAVVLKPAGIIPYYSGLVAYDVYSLVDREAAGSGRWVANNWVGHQQISLAALLDRRPRLVILDEHLYAPDRLPDPRGGDGAVEQAWRADARNRDFTSARAEVEPGRWLQYFVRNARP
jgi:arabinofuranosyltransferase